MKRSSPSTPDPDGGPKRPGCLFMARFSLLVLVLLWVGVWFAFPGKSPGRRLAMAASFSIPVGLFICVPLMSVADRRDIRRYCERRGLKVLHITFGSKVTGVTYLDGDVKRYSRWPDDFEAAATPDYEKT